MCAAPDGQPFWPRLGFAKIPPRGPVFPRVFSRDVAGVPEIGETASQGGPTTRAKARAAVCVKRCCALRRASDGERERAPRARVYPHNPGLPCPADGDDARRRSRTLGHSRAAHARFAEKRRLISFSPRKSTKGALRQRWPLARDRWLLRSHARTHTHAWCVCVGGATVAPCSRRPRP